MAAAASAASLFPRKEGDPGSSSGDLQQFYDLDCTLDLPPDMVLGRPGARRSVRIKVRAVKYL